MNDEAEGRLTKVRSIIQQEFEKELNDKEKLAIEVQERIQQVQRHLKILKYVASYSLYHNTSLKTEDGDSAEYAIHPSVQQLLPCKPQSKPVTSPPPPECKHFKKFDDSFIPKDVNVVRGTYKIKHHMVIGNNSKWIPPEAREDEATHKWMMYIRDKSRDSEMRQLIKKVRYFLHESYKPQDIIDVTSYPFYLSRRGWGEFPVRVQIHFKNTLNRPIDIVHPLRLDMTNSGVPKLGCETVLEVFLFHDDLVGDSEDNPQTHKNSEHVQIEHNYFSRDREKLEKPLYHNQILGKNIVANDEYKILKECDLMGIDYFTNVYNRAANIHFFSTEACVKWFLNLWPIITESAQEISYKEIHPYSCPSFLEYSKYNIGKQRACEWYRSWMIRNMIKKLNLSEWTTRQIFMYSKMHGYVINYDTKYYIRKPIQNISTFTNHVDSSCDLRSLEVPTNSEEIIDVIGEDSGTTKRDSPVKVKEMVYHVNSPMINYVTVLGKQIGVKFGDEEIQPGVFTNVSNQILASICKLFVQDLTRKTFCNAWLRNYCKCPGSIEVSDVVSTILESPEFDILSNVGLGSKMSNI